MARTGRRVQELRSLWVLLIAVGMLAGVVITSCGGSGGGGGSDGELCDQCGDEPDGPCIASITITPGPDDPDDRIPSCTRIDPTSGACTVELACRRKVDDGQRRCYPLVVVGPKPTDVDVDYQFRCDGSRPGGTPLPAPTPTLTPSAEPTSTAAGATCGNGVIESGEECDGTNLGNENCESQNCDFPGGSLSCFNCQFTYGTCAGGGQGCGQ